MIALTKEISSDQMEWRNHPSINSFTRQNGIIGLYDMDRWHQRLRDDPSIQMFGILYDQENIGTCGLTSINPVHGTAEFSLLIAPKWQKKGFGKKSLIELLRYGFLHLRLNCIYGETFQMNPALKMFLHLGMKEEGTLRQRYFKNGAYINSIMVSILAEEAQCQSWWKPS